MKKRILSAILCVITVVGAFGLPSAQAVSSELAASENLSGGAELRWANTASITLNMQRNNNRVTSDSVIVGFAGTTRISASFTLEKLVNGEYVNVDSWTASSNSMILNNSRVTPNCTAGTYKLSVSATVTRNGTPENVSYSLVEKL